VRVRRRGAAGAAVLLAGAILAGLAPAGPARDEALPALGETLGDLPAGPMKALADQACLHCHSADIVLQQRLTEKQWTAEVTKMVGWGAAVPEDQRAALAAYLFEHFGPENDRFRPIAARPLGR
jgi:mono/diheme cytochrome c family protein